MPAHEQHGNEHRRQRQGHREDREADLARAVRAPPAAASRPSPCGGRCSPASRWHRRRQTRSTASAPSSTGCPGCSRSRYITAKVPTIESGSARLGMRVAETLRRNRKITRITSASVSTIVNCTSSIESRIVSERSYRMSQLHRRRHLRSEGRQQSLTALRDLHRVRARLALDRQDHRAVAASGCRRTTTRSCRPRRCR